MSELPIIDLKNGLYTKDISNAMVDFEKNHPVNRCVSELDLLDSVIGMSFKYVDEYEGIQDVLLKIQDRMVYLRAEILTHPRNWGEFCQKNKCISIGDIQYLDKLCVDINKSIKDDGQIIGNYGSNGESSAYFDYAECVCKKFEIVLHDLNDNIHSTSISPYIFEYINKLGYYLYLIARYLKG